MSRKYSREVYLFVLNHSTGKTTGELLELVNKRFGDLFNYKTLRAYKKNHGIQSGVKGGTASKGKCFVFTPEIEQFIKENAWGKPAAELTQLVNEKFKTDFNSTQISGYKKRHNIKSGIDTKFKKGSISHNKGQKMSAYTYAKCSGTMFKKGNRPQNYKPVGTEVIESKNHYIKIKIADPNVWVLKHVYLWEQATGQKVPKDSIVTFLDGNKRNFDINNLACITKNENARLNNLGLRSEFAEITQANVNLVRLNNKILEKKRGDKN